MKKTSPGTRALIREYLRRLKKENYVGLSWSEQEISKRIGPKNAVLLDGRIISAHCGEIKEGTLSYWIFVHNRIHLDDQDDQIPIIETPFDDLEDEEDIISKE